MDRKVFTAILLAIVVVGLVMLTFALFRPFLLALLWAGALAVVTYSPYLQLVGKLGGRSTLAAAIMTAAIMVVILGPFFTLALYFIEDAADLAQDLQADNVEARLQNLLDHPIVLQVSKWAERFTGEGVKPDAVVGALSKTVGPIVKQLGSGLSFLGSLLAGLFFVALSLFYLYRDGPALVSVMKELLPMPDDDRDEIFGDIAGAATAAIRGGLLVAVVQGLLGFIILFILGQESPVLWAAVMALASLIPLVGTALVWAPIALLFITEGDMTRGLVLMGYGALIIGGADNLLRPILVGKHMEAHPLLLFFGTLGGIAMFGFAGIILGPVAVAFLTATTRLFRREFKAAGA